MMEYLEYLIYITLLLIKNLLEDINYKRKYAIYQIIYFMPLKIN